ncbi:hypothetical protein GLOIN_2v1872262 [Rhizophagus irregularis DAOM 181602=DAOM 197198]|uniref:Uncharacterized protein n=2 Tax=Rhizophagus irregularis TaxID=588596 RepID=U9TZQ8_RHIID|nr:hypothetical protein GLOIN_2v1872262 [Rhizophagus irregularis DAOM 181602=DAOM 197198]EXX76916.1 hypothetical protein RirG_028600 [Rhizophagus irregularis DAOM 197198w]POG76252.1 hypothetical protein GLOIN_2v1872262 [Rhizophagus irregularis DAOM 181602=DAOM 197198]GBC17631.1 hypothetical protein GLOIN_2v1872262 [Rhizophagus irregularis DAOM 181602=DAOM 197198]|eukprot:XP_025183118.1 hypothetical protein GLOIN_2v1872262 [Rhizophagus irregularis DAOM 181602=DAOM 197198]
MPFESLQEVANDFEKLLVNDEDCNVIIYVGENENMKEIHAHSCILRIRSQYFHTALSKKWSEKKDGKFIFRKPNILPHLFDMIIRFIYCGRIDLEQLQGPEILKLLVAVDELRIQTLIDHIQEYLVEHQYEFLQQDPIEIIEAVYQNEIFTDLLNLSFKKICEEPEMLFNSEEFINLKPALLELLLKRDDLLSDEIVIWDNLIKWCLAQHPNISQDPTQWNNEEIKIMEKEINKFIPLIRFNHISLENFVTRIYPFKEIISKDLINNMLLFYAQNKKLNEDKRPLRQSRCNIIDSVIINQNHMGIFANWIYRKEKISGYIPYNFNLLYRASRDGNTATAFHEKCDNKGATIVVVKITNSEQIIGGYNPLTWDTSGWKSTYDSFIFSFLNKYDFKSAKVSYSNGNAKSIGCRAINGPIFGGGCDLCFYKGTWYSFINGHNSSYLKIDIPGSFKPEDYEVFQVVKK